VDPSGLDIEVVYGDNTGVPGSWLAFVQFLGWLRITHPGEKINVMRQPSHSELWTNLVQASHKDAFYYWGHGASGSIKINSEKDAENYFTLEDVKQVVSMRRLFRVGRLRHVELRSCYSVDTADSVNTWLTLAPSLRGYPDVTASLLPYPHVNKYRNFSAPIRYDPLDRWGGGKPGEYKRKNGK